MLKTTAILAAALLAAGNASATPLAVNAGWYGDAVPAATTDSSLSPFAFKLTSAGSFSLTDGGVPGDTFSVYNGATWLGASSLDGAHASLAPIGDPVGDAAWTDATYSHLSIALAAGSYSLRVQGDCGTAGCPAAFYVRADQSTPVPAPASLALFGLGAGALVAARRRG